ncbi:MAG: D-alanine--D-alanine ligase [Microgenomates bacterium 39_6]|nr:MAG: D-alanine--D-alanine ligase [Microgenomates bacterium 39_6]
MLEKIIKKRKELKIFVLCGGDSSERPGSLLSGKTILELLKNAGYRNVGPFDVTTKNFLKLVKNKPDLVFLTLHGGYGENGILQGFLELIKVPYTGSGLLASAISANKIYFNRFVSSLGYPTPKQTIIKSLADIDSLKIDFPRVIKPATQGCSYGVFYVENVKELKERARFSVRFSDSLIIEEYIKGRELTVGIFENRKGNPVILPIAETILKRKILDYEAKYPGGEHLYQTVIPAKLKAKTERKIKQMCSTIFKALDCHGYVRMDIRLGNNGNIYIIENNTLPGMISVEESDFPKMLKIGGYRLEDFVDETILSTLINWNKRFKEEAPNELEMVNYLGLKLAE